MAWQECHLIIEHGYLLEGIHKTWVGTKWSAISKLIQQRLPNPGPLPGLDANASTMRQLTLVGEYVADVPLQLPSRLYFRLEGEVQGNLTSANQEPNSCPYGFQYHGRCALIQIRGSFVSVSGGRYSCTGGTAFGISCEGCHNLPVQNLTASGCSQGNIHFFGAGPALEIRNVESFGSNRGVWSQTPSHKVLITDSYLHDNGADGVDLDSIWRRCGLV